MAIDFFSEPAHSRGSGVTLKGDKMANAKATMIDYLQKSLLDIKQPLGDNKRRIGGQSNLIQAHSWSDDTYSITLKAGGRFLYLTEDAAAAGKPSFGEYTKDQLDSVVADLIEQIKAGVFDNVIRPALTRPKKR